MSDSDEEQHEGNASLVGIGVLIVIAVLVTVGVFVGIYVLTKG